MKESPTKGENGYLFRPGDVKELTEKISRLLSDQALRKKISLRGQKSVINRFDWQVASQKYCDLIDEMCS